MNRPAIAPLLLRLPAFLAAGACAIDAQLHVADVESLKPLRGDKRIYLRIGNLPHSAATAAYEMKMIDRPGYIFISRGRAPKGMPPYEPRVYQQLYGMVDGGSAYRTRAVGQSAA